jgi:hypothetical protein
MTDTPLANIGDLTKPATVLIEKISEAVGGIFKPYQVVRVAKAEAEAERIRAEAQLQITDLQRRAMYRFLQEEAQKQANIEGITQRALPLLNEEAAPENVANDWITNFFDKSRIVSDEDMQQLWSRILAGEANAPGTFARRTVNLLADLDKHDAELFTRLCGFGWMIGNVVPLVFDVQTAIYNDQGITFNSLGHLDSLGLIQFDNLAGFRRLRLPKRARVFFYGRPVDLTFPKETDNELNLGHVLLTRAGQELGPVCGATPVEGFFEFVYDTWAASSLVPKRDAEQAAPAAG